MSKPKDKSVAQAPAADPAPKPAVPPKLVEKNVKHTFTAEEVAQLNVDFRQSFSTLRSVEADFDAVKASYKAKITEAESRMTTLDATLQAGFELRKTSCRVVYRPKDKKKDFYLAEPLPEGVSDITSGVAPVLTEDMVGDDFQIDLIQAESSFDRREEISIFPNAPGSQGVIVVGRYGGKWYSALRITVDSRRIEERLDVEQKMFGKRWDAINTAADRAIKWFNDALGKEAGKGFVAPIEKALESHVDRAE